MEILDCTLREVGYQTKWNYDSLFCIELYNFLNNIGVPYMELGFITNPEYDRLYSKEQYYAFRYCMNSNAIENIFIKYKKNTKLLAMFDLQKKPYIDILDKKDTIIDGIRIMTRSNNTDFYELQNAIKLIKDKGYEVFVNFTLAGNNTIKFNKYVMEFVSQHGVKDIYFADTESTMTKDYITNTIKIAKQYKIKLGFHFHNKNKTAIELAKFAMLQGVSYLDVTLLGEGGKNKDGNLPLEFLFFTNSVIGNMLKEQIGKYSS